MNKYTHTTVVDGEPVNIVNLQAPGRAKGFLTVEGARGKFIAHERDLAVFKERAPELPASRDL